MLTRRKMKFFCLFLTALIASAYAQTNSSAIDASPDTSTPPTTTTTTPPTTPVASSSNPTTGADTTTTVPPKTTTATLPTTSTPPIPPNTVGHWKLVNSKNSKSCVLLEMQGFFTFVYNSSVTSDKTTVKVALDNNATVGGLCVGESNDTGSDIQTIDLMWTTNSSEFKLTFTFKNYKSDDEYGLHQIDLTLLAEGDLFPGLSGQFVNFTASNLDKDSGSEYRISKGGSYYCQTSQGYSLSNTVDDKQAHVQFDMRNVRYQAFTEVDGTKFGTDEECPVDFSTSDIVPIAVGCALAALVVIVLIAYLVGRRRSRQKGYQSV